MCTLFCQTFDERGELTFRVAHMCFNYLGLHIASFKFHFNYLGLHFTLQVSSFELYMFKGIL